MPQLLQTLAIISFVIAGILFVLSLFFWFFFKIPKVVSDLTGRTARKAIAKRRKANARSGNKAYRSSPTNVNRGQLTATMPSEKTAGKPQPAKQAAKQQPAKKQPAPVETGMPETGLLGMNKADPHTEQQETAMLVDDNATTLLDEGMTMALDVELTPHRTGGKKLTMINQVMLIHTDEVI